MSLGERGSRKGGGAVAAPGFRVLSSQDVGAIRAERLDRAKEQVAAFSGLVAELQALLRSVYPPHVIAVIAGWGLRTSAGPDGVDGTSMIKGVSQHHVELLQAIALNLPERAWGQDPAEPPEIQRAIDITLKLAEAFTGRRLLESETITDPVARTQLGLQERLRVHTQMIRNWGPYQEVLRILKDLYAPLDAPFRAFHGFGVLDVIAVAEQTVAGIEAQVNDRFRLLKDIFRAADIRGLVLDFFARYPGVAGDPEAFLASLHPEETVESVRGSLLAHADRWLVVNSIVPVTAVATITGIPEAQVRTILDRLSLVPGALADNKLEFLFLDNPVWTKPGLKSGDSYFFAFPQTAVSFMQDILRGLCAETGLKANLERRRKTYLERETERVIKQALPSATVTRGAKWLVWETDVLVLLDRAVLIVECKSATLSAQGLRGAPERARRHVAELIKEASIQSSRLEGLLVGASGGDAEALETVRGLGLEPAEIDEVIRISVTLDDLSVLASAETDLKIAGWIPADLDLATTVNIADLTCIAAILPRPSQFLHYFSERSRVQKASNIFGFELDFLGLYLATGFSLAVEEGLSHIDITPMSQAVDRYYYNLELGLAVDKPATRMAPMFAAILDQLEARRPPGWTTMALDLLSVGNADDQAACERMVEEVRQKIIAAPEDPDQPNFVIRIPPGDRDVALIFHVYPQALRAKCADTVLGVAEHVLDGSDRKRCLVIRRIETWEEVGYEKIAVAGRPD